MYCYFLFVQNMCLGISSNIVLPNLSDVITELSWLGSQRYCYKHVDSEGLWQIAGDARILAITSGSFYNKCAEVVETKQHKERQNLCNGMADKYRVIRKSLRKFRTRLRNNQDRQGRKEHINR